MCVAKCTVHFETNATKKLASGWYSISDFLSWMRLPLYTPSCIILKVREERNRRRRTGGGCIWAPPNSLLRESRPPSAPRCSVLGLPSLLLSSLALMKNRMGRPRSAITQPFPPLSRLDSPMFSSYVGLWIARKKSDRRASTVPPPRQRKTHIG